MVQPKTSSGQIDKLRLKRCEITNRTGTYRVRAYDAIFIDLIKVTQFIARRDSDCKRRYLHNQILVLFRTAKLTSNKLAMFLPIYY